MTRSAVVVLREGRVGSIHLPEQVARGLLARCVACRQSMTVVEAGHRTHPTCRPVERRPAARITHPAVVRSGARQRVADFDLSRLTRRESELWHLAYVRGYLEGSAVQQDEDFAPFEAAARRVVGRMAAIPPRDVLAELRAPGELGARRARAIRDDWHRRDAAVEAAGGWGR